MGTPFAKRRLAQIVKTDVLQPISQSKCSVTKFGRISLPS